MRLKTFTINSGFWLFWLCLTAQAQSLDWGNSCRQNHLRQWLDNCADQADQALCLPQYISQYNHLPFAAEPVTNPPNKDPRWNALLQEQPLCDDYDHGEGQLIGTVQAQASVAQVLGQIPAGKAEVHLALTSFNDIDLQLYHGDRALVDSQNGLLNQATLSSTQYQGLTITYSGYAGDETSHGNEFIHLSGITDSPLTIQIMAREPAQIEFTYQWGLDPTLGATRIANDRVFDELAGRSSIPGALDLREVKFLIKDISTNQPSVYFINGKNVPYHIDFAYDVLQWYPGLSFDQAFRVFSSSSYFLDDRQHLVGSVMAHDHLADPLTTTDRLYTLNMWPTDPVSAELITRAHQLLSAYLPAVDPPLVYHLASDTQLHIYQDNAELFADRLVPVIDSERLFANQSFTAMNGGEGYGILRIVGEGDDAPSVSDVVIFTFIPNDLSHVAGIITDTPQTPLSHVNLKAKQNNTPNAYIADATNHPNIAPLIGQLVHYQVTQDGFSITAASQADADAWLDAVRPINIQTPLSDLSVTLPARLDTLGHHDWVRFGAKAANVAELAKVLEPGTYPEGYAIPFATYHEFMQLNRCEGLDDDGVTPNGTFRDLCSDPDDPAGLSLYQQIQQIMDEPGFADDPNERATRLSAFRKTIRKAEVPAEMAELLETIRYFWDPDGDFTHSIRLRSSTNNEDLAGFNGAGLYESNTHHPDEGLIAESVKKVWASLWTARAFEERRFYRIDHFQTYMGVLAHLSYGDEQVNGVAVTKNIYDRNWEGYYVNAQYGEISVTNPEPIITSQGEVAAIPDEFLLARLVSSETGFQWVQQFIRRSNVETVYGAPVPTQNVLNDDEVTELRIAMQRIQRHFKNIYRGGDDFAMDIEFKITATDDGSRGHLEIKQARPWID